MPAPRSGAAVADTTARACSATRTTTSHTRCAIDELHRPSLLTPVRPTRFASPTRSDPHPHPVGGPGFTTSGPCPKLLFAPSTAAAAKGTASEYRDVSEHREASRNTGVCPNHDPSRGTTVRRPCGLCVVEGPRVVAGPALGRPLGTLRDVSEDVHTVAATASRARHHPGSVRADPERSLTASIRTRRGSVAITLAHPGQVGADPEPEPPAEADRARVRGR